MKLMKKEILNNGMKLLINLKLKKKILLLNLCLNLIAQAFVIMKLLLWLLKYL